MNPRDPFGAGVAGDGYGFIFVTRESLEKCLGALAGPSQPENDWRGVIRRPATKEAIQAVTALGQKLT
jgi:hypothetical protein